MLIEILGKAEINFDRYTRVWGNIVPCGEQRGRGDFPNWGWAWGGIPHIRKFPIALFRKEEKTKRKKGKKKEMLDPTHYPA
jgi:hypothetical protein